MSGAALSRPRDYMYVTLAEPKPPISFDELVLLVTEEFGLAEVQLFGQRRKRPLVHARKALWFLAREFTRLSLPQLGRMTGGRDHTTVLHGLQSIHLDCERYPRFRKQLEALHERAGRA